MFGGGGAIEDSDELVAFSLRPIVQLFGIPPAGFIRDPNVRYTYRTTRARSASPDHSVGPVEPEIEEQVSMMRSLSIDSSPAPILTSSAMECGVCMEVISHNISLACGHIFCFGCVTSIFKSKTEVKCPKCRVMCKKAGNRVCYF